MFREDVLLNEDHYDDQDHPEDPKSVRIRNVKNFYFNQRKSRSSRNRHEMGSINFENFDGISLNDNNSLIEEFTDYDEE